MEPEHYPAPAPTVSLNPSALRTNRFLSPPRPYSFGPFFLAKLRSPLYLKYCNLVATPDGVLIHESYPNRGATFGKWPFTYLPGIESTDEGYIYSPGPAVDVPDDVLIVAHSSASVFGHFVMDSLSVAISLRRQIVQRGLKIALFQPQQWMLDLLRFAGIPQTSIITLSERIVRFRSAIITSALAAQTTYTPGSLAVETFDHLRRRTFLRARVPPLKLFLRRGGATARMSNESEVADLFAEAGYAVLSPHKMSIPTQMAIASGAVAVAASYGSGHALSGFMSAGATVIELLPSDAEDNWFIRLAARRHLNHRIVVVERSANVDVQSLKTQLEGLL